MVCGGWWITAKAEILSAVTAVFAGPTVQLRSIQPNPNEPGQRPAGPAILPKYPGPRAGPPARGRGPRPSAPGAPGT